MTLDTNRAASDTQTGWQAERTRVRPNDGDERPHPGCALQAPQPADPVLRRAAMRRLGRYYAPYARRVAARS